MSDRSGIEWCDATWNPIRGCSRVSDGCRHCYAEIMAARFSDPGRWGHGFATRNPARWTGRVALIEDRLNQPLRWRKPRRIFVNSTSDLFHEKLDEAAIDRVFAVMALCPQHTFLILTKRPDRMRNWTLADRRDLINSHAGEILDWSEMPSDVAWPPPNVWLGVSVEDQPTADERIPPLLATPAAKRFVSYEPALGPVNLSAWDRCNHCGLLRSQFGENDSLADNRLRWEGNFCFDHYDPYGGCDGTYREHALDWVIAGGESGPNARPAHPDWFRSVRDPCQNAGVPFFFKQWGQWKDGSDFAPDAMAVLANGQVVSPTREALLAAENSGADVRKATMMRKVGKRRAGRLLDGREWNEVPT